MARRYARLWSIAAALLLFVIVLTSLRAFRPLQDSPAVLIEPESLEVVPQDEKQAVPSAANVLEAEEQESGGTDFPTFKSDGEEQQSPDSPGESEEGSNEDDEDTTSISFPTESINDESEDADSKAAGPTTTTSATLTTTTTSATPTPTVISKVIVMGKLMEEETDWVSQDLSDWQSAIYIVNVPPEMESPTGLRTKMNKGREAMAYLTYIIDNYPNYPDVMVFIHPHRNGMPQAWHNDARGNDAVNMLNDLRLETVVDRGYVNLRCNNEVGCPDEVQPFRDPPDQNKHAEHAYPYIYAHFFNTTFASMREQIPVIATPCCAQFALSRDQILKKPKYEYLRYRDFLEETHYDDATSGRVMEYMWHIIFGREAVHCDDMFECWCAVYGRCFGNHGSERWHPQHW